MNLREATNEPEKLSHAESPKAWDEEHDHSHPIISRTIICPFRSRSFVLRFREVAMDIRKEVRELISLNERIQSAVLQGEIITSDEAMLIRQCASELFQVMNKGELFQIRKE